MRNPALIRQEIQNPNMIVAIDGPAGSGKSTVARKVAEKLGFFYVDTGAMYRALTLKVIRSGMDFEDEDSMHELALNTDIQLKEEEGSLKVYMDREDVSLQIRKPEVTNRIFHVADKVRVREVMVGLQRKIGRSRNSVFEGRDITTVVFPDAEFKFFLDADFEERAQRRHREYLQKGLDIEYEEVKEDLRKRDIRDTSRPVGALRLAQDAVRIDTTGMTIDEVVEEIFKRVKDGTAKK